MTQRQLRQKYRPRVITVRYTINGANFRRLYPLWQHAVARERIEALRESGVRVRVKGWPKIIRNAEQVPPLEEQ